MLRSFVQPVGCFRGRYLVDFYRSHNVLRSQKPWRMFCRPVDRVLWLRGRCQSGNSLWTNYKGPTQGRLQALQDIANNGGNSSNLCTMYAGQNYSTHVWPTTSDNLPANGVCEPLVVASDGILVLENMELTGCV